MKAALKYISKISDINLGLLRVACLFIIFAILTAGLWPFNIFPKNKVKWIEKKNGIIFYGQSIASNPVWLQKSNKIIFPDKSISMELWIKPLNEPGNLPNIVSLYDGKLPEVISVGQWRSHLIIKSRTNKPSEFKRGKPYKERGLSNALLKNREVFISIISDKTKTAVYVNGILARFYPGFCLLSEYKDEPFRIILGNSPTGQSFWNGEFMGLAIYNKALTRENIYANYQTWIKDNQKMKIQNPGLVCFYPFDERKGSIIHNRLDSNYPIVIHEKFRPVQRVFLESPLREEKWNTAYIRDVTVNLIGFIPFGIFMAALLVRTKKYRRKIIFFVIIIAGFTLSLSIELIQAYLPTRFSQLSDLILNTCGTAIGVFTFNFLYGIGEKKSL